MLEGLIVNGTKVLKIMAGIAGTAAVGSIMKYFLTNHTDEAIGSAMKRAEATFIAKLEEKEKEKNNNEKRR